MEAFEPRPTGPGSRITVLGELTSFPIRVTDSTISARSSSSVTAPYT
jgi:hypothetical protein